MTFEEEKQWIIDNARSIEKKLNIKLSFRNEVDMFVIFESIRGIFDTVKDFFDYYSICAISMAPYAHDIEGKIVVYFPAI